jgi:predicted aconitase
MYLTKEEENMLKGEFGEPTQTAMDVLVKLGESYDAERMVKINSAHVSGVSYRVHGDPGLGFFESLAEKGASVRVSTTTNAIGIDRRNWRKLGFISEEFASKQMRSLLALECIGCLGTCSCTPYYHSSLPRFGEHIAWAESSTVPFVNSVLGARNSREGGPSALMAALTGRTPLHSYHLKKNRVGRVLVKVEVKLKGIHDFGALGYYIGKIVADKVPVFRSIPRDARTEDLAELGATLATSGAVGMYHIPGLTAEARTELEAFGGEKPQEKVCAGKRELREVYEGLTTASGKVDCVVLGCPHYSLRQIGEIVKLLKGKKIRRGVRFWIHTSEAMYALAEQVGYTEMVRSAGGLVTADTCAPELRQQLLVLGSLTVATDSAKQAFYVGPGGDHRSMLGSAEECVAAAVKGVWDG